jgi:hypothetical protein
MTIRTAKQLIDHLAECVECGKEHKELRVPTGDSKYPYRSSWAGPDGHSYRSRLHTITNSGDASKIIHAMRELIKNS